MSWYRKIDIRIHNDAKFMSLSERGKLLFLTILTHPGMTALGGMRATEAGLCEDMATGVNRISGCPAECGALCPALCPAECCERVIEDYKKAFRLLLEKGLIRHDPMARCLIIPNFLKYNPPVNPSVVIAWNEAGDLIPECSLKDQLIENTREFLKKFCKPSFLEAFRLEAKRKGTAPQKVKHNAGHNVKHSAEHNAEHNALQQEQEQEQEKELKDIDCPPTLIKPLELQELWNKYAPSYLPRKEKLNKTLQTLIRTRLKDHPESEWWTMLFQDIDISDFYSGRNGKWPGLDFEWAVKNCEKLRSKLDREKTTMSEDEVDRWKKQFLQN